MSVLSEIPDGPGKHTRIVGVPLAGGAALPIPVHVLRGSRRGPVLLLVAGEHGAELNGVAAIDRLVRDLIPEEVAGTVLAVPVVNPPAINHRRVEAGTPTAGAAADPYRWNTYRRWPGNRNGTPAERIAATLMDAVVRDADAVINVHAWSWYAASCTFASTRHPQSLELGRAFGLAFVAVDLEEGMSTDGSSDPNHNTLTSAALACGKPAILVELRTQVWFSPESVRDGICGVRNVMQALGMLAGHPVRPAVQYEFREEQCVYAPAAGLFVPVTEIGQSVRQGDVLGYLLDVETGRRRDVLAPCDGAVWLVSRVATRIEGGMEKRMDAYAETGDLLALIKIVTPGVVGGA